MKNLKQINVRWHPTNAFNVTYFIKDSVMHLVDTKNDIFISLVIVKFKKIKRKTNYDFRLCKGMTA